MKYFFVITLLPFLLLSGISDAMAQQEYQIPEIHIEAYILKDGTLQIHETRHYDFQGSFSWADYRLPRTGFEEIRRIRVTEGDQEYSQSDSGEPGTYSVTLPSDEVVITWHYNAADTTRIFTLSYELSGAILHGEEWSELFWTWIGSGREKSTPVFSASLFFPEELTSDALFFWSRTPEGVVDFTHEANRLFFSAGYLSRSQDLPIRILMPVTLFDPDGILEKQPSIDLERITAEEEEIARKERERQERRAAMAELAPGLTLLLSLLSIGFFIAIYRNFGRRYQTKTISSVSTTMIPDDAKPALAGRLLSYYYTQPLHLTATLFDLARRGWFTLKETQEEKKWYQSKPETDFVVAAADPSPVETLPNWEQITVDFVMSRILSGKSKFSELFAGTDSSTAKWYRNWTKEVGEEFSELRWKDQRSVKGVIVNIIAQAILILLSILLMISGGTLGLAALIVAAIMLAASAAILRRTREGEEAYRRWKAYRKGLSKADERILFKGNLDRHFVYAIAFGLREKELTRLIDQGSRDSSVVLFPWLLTMPGSGSTPVTAARNLATQSVQSAAAGGIAGGGASVGSAGGGARGGAG